VTAQKCLLAAAMMLALSATNAAAQEWYVAHLGQETCVPIDDIDMDTGRRLYYHTGSMHTPQQFEQMFARLGVRVNEEPPPIPDKTFAFEVIFSNADTTHMVLFNDEAICKFAMSKLRP
jgi:hypothetical protein